MTEIPLITLPERGQFGPRIQVEFELDILLAILQIAGPEIGRLDNLRIEGGLEEAVPDPRVRRAIGTTRNDLIRLTSALEGLGFIKSEY